MNGCTNRDCKTPNAPRLKGSGRDGLDPWCRECVNHRTTLRRVALKARSDPYYVTDAYVIQNTETKHIKLGYGSPRIRLGSLQTGNHAKLELIGTSNGGDKMEKWAQWKLRRYHVRGEWYEWPRDAKSLTFLEEYFEVKI